jgi:hypothetical protein
MLVFFWRGKGWLVPVITIGAFIGTQLAVNSILNDQDYYTQNTWPKILAGIIAAAGIWISSYNLNSAKKSFSGDLTGESEATMSPQHSFMFIPMEYWALIIIVFILIF